MPTLEDGEVHIFFELDDLEMDILLSHEGRQSGLVLTGVQSDYLGLLSSIQRHHNYDGQA